MKYILSSIVMLLSILNIQSQNEITVESSVVTLRGTSTALSGDSILLTLTVENTDDSGDTITLNPIILITQFPNGTMVTNKLMRDQLTLDSYLIFGGDFIRVFTNIIKAPIVSSSNLISFIYQITAKNNHDGANGDNIPTPLSTTVWNQILIAPSQKVTQRPKIISFKLSNIPTNAIYCSPPYRFQAYRNNDENPYFSVCSVYAVGNVSFTTTPGSAYRVEFQAQGQLIENAPDTNEQGWLQISPTIQGFGTNTLFQFGVPTSIGFIRIKQTL